MQGIRLFSGEEEIISSICQGGFIAVLIILEHVLDGVDSCIVLNTRWVLGVFEKKCTLKWRNFQLLTFTRIILK